jgi:hypothetical protein
LKCNWLIFLFLGGFYGFLGKNVNQDVNLPRWRGFAIRAFSTAGITNRNTQSIPPFPR